MTATPERTLSTIQPVRSDERTGRPFAMVSPHTNTTNTYIEVQKALLAAIGYEVVPLSVAFLFAGGFRKLVDSRNVLVVHWLEARPYQKRAAQMAFSARGSGEFLFYVVVMLLARARSVYFVHNRAVHDTQGWRRWLSSRLIRLVARSATRCVVHDPASASRAGSQYLPHPLYWDAPVIDRSTSKGTPSGTETPTERRAPVFGILGALRPYKGIVGVLEAWPSGCRLTITGMGSDEYVRRLTEVIERRHLSEDVSIEQRFIPETEFAAKLAQIDILLIPQMPNTMLVSGAFFEAIGQVPKIVARASPFMRWAESHFDGVHCFTDDSELPRLVRDLVRAHREPSAPERDRKTALREFGWQACVGQYSKFFGGLG